MIYFSFVHSVISYGIIFWDTSFCMKVIFKILKRIIRVIMNSDSKYSCCELFKKLYILPLYSQYIFSIMFVIRSRGLFKTNCDVHSCNTRTNYDLHPPTANLTLFQKRVCYSGMNIYNHLPLTLKHLLYDINKFKSALKRFLLTTFLYSLEEYFSWIHVMIFVLLTNAFVLCNNHNNHIFINVCYSFTNVVNGNMLT
jgi:hypothetical protein